MQRSSTLRIWVWLATACWWCAAVPPAARAESHTNLFVHPGLSQTRAGLEFMKRKVDAGEEPWRTAWTNLLREPYSAMDFQPRAIAHVIRGPYGRPSVGDRDLMNSAKAAYSQALQWWLTGDRAHAQKAIAILRAWAAVLADFHENDAKLLAGWTGHDFCNAAEILRYTGAEWDPKDLAQFKQMLLTVYYPLIRDFFPEANGNWDGAITDTMLCIGVFCDDRAIFDRAVDHFQRGSGNGGITKYIYPSGQCQETTRDQGHTQLGLGEFAQACQVAWNQGVDLYGAANNRLALGFEYTASYMLGTAVPVFGVMSARGRERLSDIYEPVYQHYYCLNGLGLPWTARAVESTRTNHSWSALVFYRGPVPGSVRSSVSCPQTLTAGALTGPVASPPANAALVSPGQSIQDALDACRRAGGGSVVLTNGLYVLPSALRLPSGVTLAGQGIGTVLFLDPKTTNTQARAALMNADADLHDVTIRDLVIEGADSSKTSTDPNADRRRRARPNAPPRAGLALTGPASSRMRRLRLEHVTVRNCTENGVAIRRAAGVVIAACDISDNGSGALPGAGAQHNLLIFDAEDCEVKDCRLDTSPGGCGLVLDESRDVRLSNNEIARNALQGLYVTGSRQVRVLRTLAEGNDGDGIRLGGPGKGCRDIDVRDNLCRNNGGWGLELVDAIEGSLRENKLADNGKAGQMQLTGSERIKRE